MFVIIGPDAFKKLQLVGWREEGCPNFLKKARSFLVPIEPQ
jgi:hypothetical protein